MFFNKIIVFFLIALTSNVYADDVCLNWFQNSGVKPGSKSCLISCDLIVKDMSTFMCADRCGEFCKNKKCISDPYWKNKLKKGPPKDWVNIKEQSSEWSDLEIKQMMAILNQLPDVLKDLPIEGIFRMKTSDDIINPGSTSMDGKSIMIYDRAFHSPFWPLSSVITHEIGHVVFINLSETEKSNT